MMDIHCVLYEVRPIYLCIMYINFCLKKKGNLRMCNGNVDARSFNHCCGEKAIIITYSEFVFAALGFQHVILMRHIFMCGLSSSTVFFFFTLSHKWHDFRKKKLLNIKCVSIFSTALSEAFFILRRNERIVIKMYIGLHAKYPLFLPYLN